MIERGSEDLKVALFRIGIEQLCTVLEHLLITITGSMNASQFFASQKIKLIYQRVSLEDKDGNSMLLLLCDNFITNTQRDATSLAVT